MQSSSIQTEKNMFGCEWDQHLTLQSSMLAFHHIVSAKLRLSRTLKRSGPTKRLLIHCLLIYATNFFKPSTCWPSSAISGQCYWQPAQYHQEATPVGWADNVRFSARLDSPDMHLWGRFLLGAWKLLEHNETSNQRRSWFQKPVAKLTQALPQSRQWYMTADGLLGFIWRELFFG